MTTTFQRLRSCGPHLSHFFQHILVSSWEEKVLWAWAFDDEEVSKINDDDNGDDNYQNDVDFAFRNCFSNAAFWFVKEMKNIDLKLQLQLSSNLKLSKKFTVDLQYFEFNAKIFAYSSGNWKHSHSFICWNI